jgi:hypothetical protein
MFEDDLIIGDLRFEYNRLENILKSMERDENRNKNFNFYAQRLQEVEKGLRKIRNRDLEVLEKYFV